MLRGACYVAFVTWHLLRNIAGCFLLILLFSTSVGGKSPQRGIDAETVMARDSLSSRRLASFWPNKQFADGSHGYGYRVDRNRLRFDDGECGQSRYRCPYIAQRRTSAFSRTHAHLKLRSATEFGRHDGSIQFVGRGNRGRRFYRAVRAA